MRRSDCDQTVRIFDRRLGSVCEENVYRGRAMRWLYGTRIGFIASEFAAMTGTVNRAFGAWYRRDGSRAVIESFVKEHDIDLSEASQPLEAYRDFNAFFERRLKAEARPVDHAPESLIAAADARLMAYEISDKLVIPVKGRAFSIRGLTGGLAMDLLGPSGTCLVLRLAPADYHRFHYIDAGEQVVLGRLGGLWRAVSPLSLAWQRPVFEQNRRDVTLVRTANFGPMVQIEVGALMVGQVNQSLPDCCRVSRGGEKGWFSIGASTIVQLFSERAVRIDADIWQKSKDGIETRVRFGEKIGCKGSGHTCGRNANSLAMAIEGH